MSEALHVLDIAAHADAAALLPGIGALERHGVRVSVLCASRPVADALRDGNKRTVLVGALDDDPAWTTIRLAASWSRHERVSVLRAHDSAAHVLAVLAGALCDRPTVALLGAGDVPMLDLEAHRLGDAGYLCMAGEAAVQHARALGVPAARVQLVDDAWPCEEKARAMVDLLRRAARSDGGAGERAGAATPRA